MKRLDAGIALSVFVVALTFYIRTLAPSLLYGDSAEFQTIASTLGMGHPTGYPVYILLAKLFTFLPFGDIAYRVNLLSAVAAALTIALTYLILRKLGAFPVVAGLGVFMLAFAALFWKHASIAEIYTISSACLAFIFYCILAWKDSGNSRWLFVAGLFGGLSLGIHTTISLSAVAILLYLALSARRWVDWLHSVLGAVAGIVIFLAAFMLLDVINASAGYYNTVVYHALSVWGMTPADFDSPFERLAFLYFPPQFSGQFFAVSSEVILERLKEFFEEISWNAAIALLGLASLFIPRKGVALRWREAILWLLGFATFLLFAASYDVYDYYVFYIPAILFLAIATGLGFAALSEVIFKIPKLPSFIAVLMMGVLIIANVWISFPYIAEAWESRIPPGLEDYETVFFTSPDMRRLLAEQKLKQVEDNAIIFTDWDNAYNFYYVAHVLQGRTEMDFHETNPQSGVSSLADSTLQYIEANIGSRPVYFVERPFALTSRYQIQRAGSGLYRITRK